MNREEALNKIGELVVYARAQGWDEGFTEAFEALSVEPCEDTISFPKGTLKKRGKGYVVYNPEWLKENWRTELNVMGVECEDAISREDALDAFGLSGKTRKYGGDHSGYDTMMLYEIQDVIEYLPSVTPKVSECEDCISRAELLKAIDTWDRFGVDDTNSLFRLDNLSLPHYVPYIHFDDVVKCIKGMPSVTPKQKMGRWIREERHHTGQDQEFDYVVHFCSECGAQKRIGWMGVKYCPECGTKMSENPTGSNCTACIIDGTDACSRGAGRAVDGRVCEDFVGESED